MQNENVRINNLLSVMLNCPFIENIKEFLLFSSSKFIHKHLISFPKVIYRSHPLTQTFYKVAHISFIKSPPNYKTQHPFSNISSLF